MLMKACYALLRYALLKGLVFNASDVLPFAYVKVVYKRTVISS